MEETKEIIKGRAYNFTFDPVKRKRVVGWYVIITEGGQEYLVKQNSSQPWRCYRKVYQSDYSFKDLLVSAEDLKRNTWRTPIALIPLGAAFGNVLSRFTPDYLVFGKINSDFDFLSGIGNILLMCLTVLLAFLFLVIYRKGRLKFYLRNRQGNLLYVGKIKSNTPIFISSKGREFW